MDFNKIGQCFFWGPIHLRSNCHCLLIPKQAAVAPDLRLINTSRRIHYLVFFMDSSQADLYLFHRDWRNRSVNSQMTHEYIWSLTDRETKLLIKRTFDEKWNTYFQFLCTFYDWYGPQRVIVDHENSQIYLSEGWSCVNVSACVVSLIHVRFCLFSYTDQGTLNKTS